MLRGTKIQATNAVDVGTAATITNMLTLPTGKTFILTDLVALPTYAIDDSHTTYTSNDVLRLYDGNGDGSTELSGTVPQRLTVHFPLVQLATTGTGNVPKYQRQSVVLHFTNGPEFSTGVTPQMAGGQTNIIGTGCIWIGGILR